MVSVLGNGKGVRVCCVAWVVFFIGIETGLLCHEGRICSLAFD